MFDLNMQACFWLLHAKHLSLPRIMGIAAKKDRADVHGLKKSNL